MFVEWNKKRAKKKLLLNDWRINFLQSSTPKFKLVVDKGEIDVVEIINDEGAAKKAFDELRARVAIAEKNKACCEKAKKVWVSLKYVLFNHFLFDDFILCTQKRSKIFLAPSVVALEYGYDAKQVSKKNKSVYFNL